MRGTHRQKKKASTNRFVKNRELFGKKKGGREKGKRVGGGPTGGGARAGKPKFVGLTVSTLLNPLGGGDGSRRGGLFGGTKTA